jgi:flagellar biosynthesis protein FliQ
MTESGEDEKPTYKDMYRKTRSAMLAVLMTPVVGMVVSIFLVIWKFPGRIMFFVPVILFILAQYLLLVKWIDTKINDLIKS